MSGPITPNPHFNDPAALAQVARDFPALTIVVYHGYWPRVQEALGIAFLYPNVHLVPDMYLFMPGSRAYIDAANGYLKEQLLFGSSYPFRPMQQSIEDSQAIGFNSEALEYFFEKNAKRVLRIE